MAVIVTNANWLQVDGARLQKGKWDLSLTKAGVRLSDAGQSINIPYLGTTIDGAAVESSAALFAFFEAQGFNSAGTGPGSGVQSIQEGPGISVDDTDPFNPVLSTNFASPTWDDVDGKPEFIAAGLTAAAARGAIGLGSASTRPAGDFDSSGSAAAAELAAKEYTDLKVAGVYKFKGSVADFASLPATDMVAGDVYNLLDTDMNYGWTGAEWDPLGTTVDLSNYYSKPETDGLLTAKVGSKQENGLGGLVSNMLTFTVSTAPPLVDRLPGTIYVITED